MIAHNHVLQGATPGCRACENVRPESQVHPYSVPPLPAGYVPATFGPVDESEPEEDEDDVDPETPAHVAALPQATHRIVDGRPVCDGGIGTTCHWWPDAADCEHESFPCGHEYVFHEDCWIIDWLAATDLEDSARDDANDHRDDDLRWPNGVIDWEWDGDYVLWWYVSVDTATVPLADGRRDSDEPLW